MSRATHDRTALHSGLDTDLVELLSDAVGELPAGTSLHDTLVYLHSWILDLENPQPTISSSFTIDSIARRTVTGSFTADATKRRTVSGSLTANASINASVSGSFTENAVIKKTFSVSITADAVIAGGGGGGLTALQIRSFDRSMNNTNVLPDAPMIRIYKKDHFR